jgi:hypothetical protein
MKKGRTKGRNKESKKQKKQKTNKKKKSRIHTNSTISREDATVAYRSCNMIQNRRDMVFNLKKKLVTR